MPPALVIGIDEAGRGAQLGPLVLAAVGFDEIGARAFVDLGGLDHPKTVTSSRRAQLAALILRLAVWSDLECRSAATVDRYVARGHGGLNRLEREMAVALLRRAPPCTRVIADGRALFSRLGRRWPAVVAVDHADEQHPAVAAAAFCAKVERERRLEKLQERTASLLGRIPRRGYPGPEMTRWIERYESFFRTLPPELRSSWGRATAFRPAETKKLLPIMHDVAGNFR